jgi:hypothetical protein
MFSGSSTVWQPYHIVFNAVESDFNVHDFTRLMRAIVCGEVVCTKISSFSSIESPKVSHTWYIEVYMSIYLIIYYILYPHIIYYIIHNYTLYTRVCVCVVQLDK